MSPSDIAPSFSTARFTPKKGVPDPNALQKHLLGSRLLAIPFVIAMYLPFLRAQGRPILAEGFHRLAPHVLDPSLRVDLIQYDRKKVLKTILFCRTVMKTQRVQSFTLRNTESPILT